MQSAPQIRSRLVDPAPRPFPLFTSLLSGIPTVEKKNHHSWTDVSHDSSRLYASDDGMENKKGAHGDSAPIEGTDLPPMASLYKCTISFDGKHRYRAGSFAMVGLLSRSNAVCRQDWAVRLIATKIILKIKQLKGSLKLAPFSLSVFLGKMSVFFTEPVP
jgi:hypothetical protein